MDSSCQMETAWYLVWFTVAHGKSSDTVVPWIRGATGARSSSMGYKSCGFGNIKLRYSTVWAWHQPQPLCGSHLPWLLPSGLPLTHLTPDDPVA